MGLTPGELIHCEAILKVLHGKSPVGTNPPGVDGILVQDEAAHEQYDEEHEPGGCIGQDQGAGQGSDDPEQAQRKLVDQHEQEPEGEEPAQPLQIHQQSECSSGKETRIFVLPFKH